MDKLVEIKIRFYEPAARKLGGLVQFVREGDDIGSQESLLVSPETYLRYTKPRHAELFAAQTKKRRLTGPRQTPLGLVPLRLRVSRSRRTFARLSGP